MMRQPKMTKMLGRGWFLEPHRHSLAARRIKTRRDRPQLSRYRKRSAMSTLDVMMSRRSKYYAPRKVVRLEEIGKDRYAATLDDGERVELRGRAEVDALLNEGVLPVEVGGKRVEVVESQITDVPGARLERIGDATEATWFPGIPNIKIEITDDEGEKQVVEQQAGMRIVAKPVYKYPATLTIHGDQGNVRTVTVKDAGELQDVLSGGSAVKLWSPAGPWKLPEKVRLEQYDADPSAFERMKTRLAAVRLPGVKLAWPERTASIADLAAIERARKTLGSEKGVLEVQPIEGKTRREKEQAARIGAFRKEALSAGWQSPLPVLEAAKRSSARGASERIAKVAEAREVIAESRRVLPRVKIE